MGQCFLDYDGLKKFWKVVKDNFVRLGKDGSITVNAIKIKDYTDSHVLLAGGGVKPLSEIGSGGGSVSGDYLPLTGGTMTGDIIMGSSTPQMGLRDGATGLIGFTNRMVIDVDSNGSPIYFKGVTLQSGSDTSVYINSNTFTYKGNAILHAGNIDNYLPSIVTANTNGLMSATMYKAQMVKSVGVRQGSADVIVGGSITNHSVYITQKKSNITNAYQQAIGENDVEIPNATKNYDGSMSYTDKRKLDGISPHAPKKVVALRLSFNADATVTVISGGGDYDMTQDDELMGSKCVDRTSTDNLYSTIFSLDTAAASTNTLNQLFNNSFVKFSFMGKSTSGISDYSITVKSNFDADTLEIQFVSTKQDDSWVVDCVWEFF